MELLHTKSKNGSRLIIYSLLYFVFTVVALGIDSFWFSENYFTGRWIANGMAIVYFCLMYQSADAYLRKLMLVMVGLSYIGELIFCGLFGMYAYNGIHIPIYVPIGHSIVYATGYTLAKTKIVVENSTLFKKAFNVFFGTLFLGVTIFLKDYFSLISGLLFFLLLKRKKWDLKYSCIAFCVIYIELVGTSFGCWKWVPKIFGIVSTVNPPMGAVFYYAGGDVLLAKLIDKYWNGNS